MSHRSRLAGFIIDCGSGDLAANRTFWSSALGLPVDVADEDGAGKYASLKDTPAALAIEVQQVTHPSRVHLDIESDDIPAEVARLEALGATKVAWVKRWQVMQAPDGQRFCVVAMKDVPGKVEPSHWG